MKRILSASVAALPAAALLALAPEQAVAQRPLGIDVSSYQGAPGWGSVKGAGYTYAWAKATEGTYYIDSDYSYNQNNGKGAGVYMGSYHFARPDLDSPGSEANYFWNEAGGYTKSDGKTIMPVLDYETFSGVVGASGYSSWANQWCDDIVNDASGNGVTLRAVVYISACNACDVNSSVSQWISWIANYNGESPQTGGPWNVCGSCDVWGSGNWDIWQWSSSGSVPGISGNSVDLDVFDGTSSDMTGTLLVGGSTSQAVYASFVGPISMNVNNTLEIFGVGSNKDVWHNWQTAANQGWNGWVDLANGNSIAGPAVSRDLNSLIQVFVATGSGKVWHNYQKSGGGWNGWVSQGGPGVTNLVAVTNLDGRVQVFGVGTNGDLWDEWQTVVNGGWCSWADMSGQKIKAGFKVAINNDGRLEIFGQGANGDIWHNWQTTAGQGWSGWNDWGSDSSGLDPHLAVANDYDGGIEVFGVDGSGNVWHNWQVTPGCCWNGFAKMNGSGAVGAKPGLAVGINADGRLELFCVGANNDVWHVWQNQPKSSWHTWADLGGTGQNENLVVANDKNGALQVFDVGNNSHDVWHIWQNSPGGSWSSWSDQGGNGMQFYWGQP